MPPICKISRRLCYSGFLYLLQVKIHVTIPSNTLWHFVVSYDTYAFQVRVPKPHQQDKRKGCVVPLQCGFDPDISNSKRNREGWLNQS